MYFALVGLTLTIDLISDKVGKVEILVYEDPFKETSTEAPPPLTGDQIVLLPPQPQTSYCEKEVSYLRVIKISPGVLLHTPVMLDPSRRSSG